MNCNVAIIWMHDYLDDELPHDDIAGLKAHLDSCPACRTRMEQLEQTEALTHRMMDTHFVITAEQSAQLTQRIMSALPVEAPQNRNRIRTVGPQSPGRYGCCRIRARDVLQLPGDVAAR